jgi:hypothetical protein
VRPVFKLPHVEEWFISCSSVEQFASLQSKMPQLKIRPDGRLQLIEPEDLAIQQEMEEADLAWERTYGRSPSRSPSPIFRRRYLPPDPEV